jgi:hypothetical protein
VRAATEIGARLPGGYDVLVSTGAQRATQTLACLLAAFGERVAGGVVVEAGLRSRREERWREAYEKAGSGELDALRSTDPELVAEDSAALGAALGRLLDALADGGRAPVVGHSPTNGSSPSEGLAPAKGLRLIADPRGASLRIWVRFGSDPEHVADAEAESRPALALGAAEGLRERRGLQMWPAWLIRLGARQLCSGVRSSSTTPAPCRVRGVPRGSRPATTLLAKPPKATAEAVSSS